MTDWEARADESVSRARANLFDDVAQDDCLALVNERLDGSGLRGKVWGAMTYACDRCGQRERYELEVGVEGPPVWRDDGTYIACAFTAGRCDRCGGPMTHVDWHEDSTYPSPVEPSCRDVFRVPREWPVYPTRGICEDGTVITDRSCSAFLSLNLAAVPGERTP